MADYIKKFYSTFPSPLRQPRLTERVRERSKVFVILLLKFFMVLMFLPSPAHAVGIQVNPSKLHIDLATDTSPLVELFITNPTHTAQLFEIYPDDFVDFLKVSPSHFTLEAQQSKTVALSFQTDTVLIRNLQTNISVVAKPTAGTGFQANSGVKIPLTITASYPPSPNQILYTSLLFGFLAAALICFTAVYGLHRKQQRLLLESVKNSSPDY